MILRKFLFLVEFESGDYNKNKSYKNKTVYTVETDAQLKLRQVTVSQRQFVCFAGKKEDVACHLTPVVIVEEDINLDEINLGTILILHF